MDREAFIWMKQFSTLDLIAAKSGPVARWAHNPEAVGSNPTAATCILNSTYLEHLLVRGGNSPTAATIRPEQEKKCGFYCKRASFFPPDKSSGCPFNCKVSFQRTLIDFDAYSKKKVYFSFKKKPDLCVKYILPHTAIAFTNSIWRKKVFRKGVAS